MPVADGSGLAARISAMVPAPVPVEATPFHYFAFLSYGHKDEVLAKWLHESLEKYRVPRALVGKMTVNGRIPARLHPVFRDRHELAAAADLGAEIRSAISGSRFLVVLCSPAAATSRWTEAEIASFKKLRPDGCVVAAIVGGEPFASEMRGREAEECFPPALRVRYDRRGRPTKQRAEPIAADFREGGDGRRLGFLKVVAGMLGVGLDELVQRENHRRHQRLRLVAAASIAGMAVTSTLSLVAYHARNEAYEQRKEAEGLVGFMLGDLRKKLEPLGRLEVLDSVGGKALAYYEKQDKAGLSDEALAQRARALTMMSEIARTRGDMAGALERAQEALATTTEQLRRRPKDPQRLFDQAQNIFWVGYINWQRGNVAVASKAFREYRRLADRMIAADPGNPKYRLERYYADNNLGIVLIDQRRAADAVTALQQSQSEVEALAAADPRSGEYSQARLENLAWLSEAQEKAGLIDEATRSRERQLALIASLATKANDVENRRKELVARHVLGRLLAAQGQVSAGIAQYHAAIGISDTLIAIEPNNSQWLENSATTQLDLSELLLATGQADAAASAGRAGCDLTDRLLMKDRSVTEWNERLRRGCATQRAKTAFARGSLTEALALVQPAAQATTMTGTKQIEIGQFIADAKLLIGDIEASRGDLAAARIAWRGALASLPPGEDEIPYVLVRRTILLKRLGHDAGSRLLADRLDRIGYRPPEYLKAMKQGARP
ncbi:toll/interleukin-1 receptor domain-containing protein [Sphingomonas sp.]|uniref:toll/interleukin-1 receptor domain-containing protein n=1 Tax=Sphingomonas sp. TaxID=28214 RepID=UPI00286CF6F7|nr:toll/interleukin-1 receptor domain-containing protein [Sphingomonas sp.]